MTAHTTQLRLDPEHTTLTADSTSPVVLALGVRRIAEEIFRHEPPTALEMEQGIDAVEDALMRSRLPHAERGGWSSRRL